MTTANPYTVITSRLARRLGWGQVDEWEDTLFRLLRVPKNFAHPFGQYFNGLSGHALGHLAAMRTVEVAPCGQRYSVPWTEIRVLEWNITDYHRIDPSEGMSSRLKMFLQVRRGTVYVSSSHFRQRFTPPVSLDDIGEPLDVVLTELFKQLVQFCPQPTEALEAVRDIATYVFWNADYPHLFPSPSHAP